MNVVRKNIFLFSMVAVLFMPGFSGAEISFQQSQLSNPSGILENLPQPINEFIKSAKDISITAGNQLQSPVGVNLDQLKDVDLTKWFKDFFQNGSLLNEFYQLAVKLFTSVGNLFVWILNIVIELIKQILSLAH